MVNMRVNRNFVFFLYDTDYYRYAYSDLSQYNNVRVYYGFRPLDPIKKFIHKIHHSLKINRYINLPFKKMWFKSYYQLNFINEGELCFVFDARLLEFEYVRSFCNYLHIQHKKAHFVCYYQDLIRTSTDEVLPNCLREEFDLMISYDKQDAALYNIDYYPTTYSENSVDDNTAIEPCDVYFLGAAKDRWSDIVMSYDLLTRKGFKCDFYVTMPKGGANIQKDGIHYIENMSYKENLQHIKKCKFILELQQRGAVGPTLRTWEAICYNKYLITNNISIKESHFYDKKFVALILSDGIDFGDIECDEQYINTYKRFISPRNFLAFISEKLNSI